MELVFGVLLYRRFSPLLAIFGFSLVFGFGLNYRSNCLMKFLSHGFCARCGCDEVFASKAVSCKSEPLRSLESLESPSSEGFVVAKLINVDVAGEEKHETDADGGENTDDDESVCYKEDEVFDVLSLRRLVKTERRRVTQVRAELEKERMAAASAAEEAMAMILRLQNDKSSTEIQANHYRQIAEQKQQYDEAVIQSLQWIIMKHESERTLLEEQLRVCREKCSGLSEEGDPAMNPVDSTAEDGLEDVFGANFSRYFDFE